MYNNLTVSVGVVLGVCLLNETDEFLHSTLDKTETTFLVDDFTLHCDSSLGTLRSAVVSSHFSSALTIWELLSIHVLPCVITSVPYVAQLTQNAGSVLTLFLTVEAAADLAGAFSLELSSANLFWRALPLNR